MWPAPECPSALVPGTVPLWAAVGSCVQPGLAACSRTRAFLTGSCVQPCLTTVLSSSLSRATDPSKDGSQELGWFIS